MQQRAATGRQVLAVGAGAVVVAAFLPWFRFSLSGVSATASGWDTGFFWAGLPAAIALALLAELAVRTWQPQRHLPPLPLSWAQVRLAAAMVAAVLVLLKVVVGEDAPLGVEVSRQSGLLLAVLGSVAMVSGAALTAADAVDEDSGSGH